MPPRPATNDARFTVGWAFAVWAITYVAALPLQAIVISMTGHSGEKSDTWPTSLTVASIVCLWLPMLAGLVVLASRQGSGRFGADYRLRFRWIDLIGAPIGVATQLLAVPALYVGLRAISPDTFSTDKVESRARDLWDRTHGGWLVVLVVVVAVGAPVVEELVYRGLIQQSLQARIDDRIAVVIAAAFFGAIHLQPVEFPGLFVVGLVLGIAYRRTGRLGMCIIAHAAFNAAGLVLASR